MIFKCLFTNTGVHNYVQLLTLLQISLFLHALKDVQAILDALQEQLPRHALVRLLQLHLIILMRSSGTRGTPEGTIVGITLRDPGFLSNPLLRGSMGGFSASNAFLKENQ